MANEFETILADEKTFPDSLEITVGDKKHTLGSLRDLSKAKQKELAAKLASADEREKAVEKSRNEVTELAEKTAKLYADLQTAAEKATKRPDTASEDDDWENDPFYKPVATRYKKIEEIAVKLQENQEKLATAIQKAAAIFAEDRWERQWQAVEPVAKKSKALEGWDYEKVKKYAAENKVVDKWGLPDIRGAVEKLTAAERTQISANEAYEKGLREGEAKARLGTMPRPTAAARAAQESLPKGVTADENFNYLNEAVAEDPELVDLLGTLNSPEMVQAFASGLKQ